MSETGLQVVGKVTVVLALAVLVASNASSWEMMGFFNGVGSWEFSGTCI